MHACFHSEGAPARMQAQPAPAHRPGAPAGYAGLLPPHAPHPPPARVICLKAKLVTDGGAHACMVGTQIWKWRNSSFTLSLDRRQG